TAHIVLTALIVALGDCALATADPFLPEPTGRYSRDVARVRGLAAHGSARAQTQLGYRYQNGIGVPQDYGLAADWYNRAAERGEPRAQHLLGLLYDKGFGVPLDFVE